MGETLDTYNPQGEIVIYQTEDGKASLDVMLENETVWLTQDQIAALYGKSKSTISEHLSNIFAEGELDREVVVRKIRTTTQHGAIQGKTLLQIFPNRPKGTTQKMVYNDITAIREFRNRIAHHEPICFDKNGAVNTAYMQRHYNLMKAYLQYMGWNVEKMLQIIDAPDDNLLRVKEMENGGSV